MNFLENQKITVYDHRIGIRPLSIEKDFFHENPSISSDREKKFYIE